MAMVGVSELLILLLISGGPFTQILGMPPGERDQNLVHAAAENSLLYIEWAARGEGKRGAPGIDGLVAEPEVVLFLEKFKSGLENMMARNADAEQAETRKLVPELVLSLTGKPGCLFWGLDTEAAGDDMPPQLAIAMAIRAGLVVNAGDDADAITDHIKAIIAGTTGLQLDALDHTPLPLPAPVQIHRHNNYLILAGGPNAIDDVIARMETKEGGISNHLDFAAGWKDLGIDRSGLVLFVDIENGVQKIGQLTGMRPVIEQGLQMAGLAGVKWAMNVTGVADGQSVSRGHVRGITGDQGLMALVSGRGIRTDDFALVPDDSDVVLAVSVDARKILDSLIRYMGEINAMAADQLSRGYEQFSQFLEIDFQHDVFASLDHVITVSNSPGDGGWIGSSPVLTIGIKNARGAAKTSTKIAEAIERAFDRGEPNEPRRRGVTLERREFMGHEIQMVNTIGEDDVLVAPAWCVTKTHVMIALHPQPLMSRLRRLETGDWKSFGQKFANGPEGETVAFTAVDVPGLLPEIYGFMPWLGQVVLSEAQSQGFDVNLLDVPSIAAVLPYVSESRSYLVRTPAGVSKLAEGPAIFGGIPAISPLMLFGGVRVNAAPVQMEAIEVEVEAVEALTE